MSKVIIKINAKLTASQAALTKVINKESIRIFFENKFNKKVIPAIIKYLGGMSSGISIATRVKVFSKSQSAFLQDVLLEAKNLGKELEGSKFEVQVKANTSGQTFLNVILISPEKILEKASIEATGGSGRSYPVAGRRHVWRIFFKGTSVPQYTNIKGRSFVKITKKRAGSIRGIGIMTKSRQSDKIRISTFREKGRDIFSHFIFEEIVKSKKTIAQFKRLFLREFKNIQDRTKVRAR